LSETKTRFKKDNYLRQNQAQKYHDRDLVMRLEAINNILQIVDERLKKLEENN
jgi:hypothetical protein